MTRLSIDFECPASAWWERGGRELWEAIAEGASAVVLDDDLARSWLVQAGALPGWDAGPAYAPHPVAAAAAPDDEDAPA